MKSLFKILVILGFITIMASNFYHKPNELFYYAFEEKIYLKEEEDKIIFQFKTNQNSDSRFECC